LLPVLDQRAIYDGRRPTIFFGRFVDLLQVPFDLVLNLGHQLRESRIAQALRETHDLRGVRAGLSPDFGGRHEGSTPIVVDQEIGDFAVAGREIGICSANEIGVHGRFQGKNNKAGP